MIPSICTAVVGLVIEVPRYPYIIGQYGGSIVLGIGVPLHVAIVTHDTIAGGVQYVLLLAVNDTILMDGARACFLCWSSTALD